MTARRRDAALPSALNLAQSAIDNVLEVIDEAADQLDGMVRGSDVLNESTDFDHLEVFLADAAFGADEIVGNLVPRRSRSDAFVLVAFGLVVDPAANDTLPFSHLRALSTVPFQGGVRYLRHREIANQRARCAIESARMCTPASAVRSKYQTGRLRCARIE